MNTSIAPEPDHAPRVNEERRPAMLKADLRKPESGNFMAQIGACLDFARRMQGWTVDQLAAELDRDPRQVARWMRGDERTQVDVVFAVAALRQDFVIALAKLAQCQVETTIRVKRSA